MAANQNITAWRRAITDSDDLDMLMIGLWTYWRYDTVSLAAVLGLPEYKVANRLPRLIEERRAAYA
jgi:hypothetical protein